MKNWQFWLLFSTCYLGVGLIISMLAVIQGDIDKDDDGSFDMGSRVIMLFLWPIMILVLLFIPQKSK